MLYKLLLNDLKQKKLIAAVLFIFICFSALLASSGTRMILDLSRSMNYMFQEAAAPHFVQMHAGSFNETRIQKWASENPLVKEQQIQEMLNIDGSHIQLGSDARPESGSIMDMGFVTQNKRFDYLLNMENKPVHARQGEIAVPVFYMQKKNLDKGDTVTIKTDTAVKQLRISGFVRDVQMNPSIIHSKRFVVHKTDFSELKSITGESEYLIEFLLTDSSHISDFRNEYQKAGLPEKGPAIDYNLIVTLNAVTDGLIAAVVIFVSILLIIIALLCLRFTLLAAIEEDYREIGVMKAIGIAHASVKRIYLAKYIVLSASAVFAGYAASLLLNNVFSANITRYLGKAPAGVLQFLAPLFAAGLIGIVVILFCSFTLRRLSRISAVEALRSGDSEKASSKRKPFPLHKKPFGNVNLFLGVRDVFQRFRLFRLLFAVFTLVVFIIILPLNFLNTMQSPQFVTYMGIGESDIRIDVSRSADTSERFERILSHLQKDKAVSRFAPLITCRYKILNSEGLWENMNVETGDFSIFPVSYVDGDYPEERNEIALSLLSAQDLEKKAGDTIQMRVNGQIRDMKVTGIYQDITNGGRTAKAPIEPNDNRLWHIVYIDLKNRANITAKTAEYTNLFSPARVTHVTGYVHKTLGNTIANLRSITFAVVGLALCIAMLITSLFLQMLVAKDKAQITIMQSIGLSRNSIRIQYVTKTLLILGIGLIIGTLAANMLGEGIVSGLLSLFGASKISFVIDPIRAYLIWPLTLAGVVTLTTLLSIASIKRFHITDIVIE